MTVPSTQSGKRRMMQGVRRRSSIRIFGLPLYHVALGPDPDAGQIRGQARGIVAIGDIATGVLAIGGLSSGLVAIGGCAVGLIAVGGAAIGGLAFGGAAVGIAAIGGGAVGYYACGGGAVGIHVLSGVRQDPEMVELVKRFFPWLSIPVR